MNSQQNNPNLEWRCDSCYQDEDNCKCFCKCGTKLIVNVSVNVELN